MSRRHRPVASTVWRRSELMLLLVTALLVSVMTSASGQEFGFSSDEADGGTRQPQYYLAPGLEEELKIKVSVWGEVKVPGLYIVADGTDLIEVLSLAGGPTRDASLGGVKVVRMLGATPEILEIDVQEYLRSADLSAAVAMYPGDTVTVPSRFWPKVTKWAGVVTMLALVANVVVNASQ